MSNAAEDLPKIPEPQDGEQLTQEYLETAAAQGKILCVGFQHVQVAQVMALEMVRQGQLSEEALENIKGSQLYIRKNKESEEPEVTIVFHGHNPFPIGGFKPTN